MRFPYVFEQRLIGREFKKYKDWSDAEILMAKDVFQEELRYIWKKLTRKDNEMKRETQIFKKEINKRKEELSQIRFDIATLKCSLGDDTLEALDNRMEDLIWEIETLEAGELV